MCPGQLAVMCCLTENVDHRLVEHLEQRKQIQHQEPEYRNGDFVFWLILQDLWRRESQLAAPVGKPLTSHFNSAVSWR